MGKKYLYIRLDFIKHHFKLELVDSGLYFVKDEINFIYPLLQVGFGSGSGEKSTGSGSGGSKINGSGRIRILIPGILVGSGYNFSDGPDPVLVSFISGIKLSIDSILSSYRLQKISTKKKSGLPDTVNLNPDQNNLLDKIIITYFT